MSSRAILSVTAIFLFAFVGPLSAAEKNASQAESFELKSSRNVDTLDRVTVSLEIGGDLTYRSQGIPKRREMSVVGKLTYDEKILEIASEPSGKTRSARFYHKAQAAMKIDKGSQKPVLRDQHRLIGAMVDGRQRTIFSPVGPLTRAELDLIDIQTNSLLLDRLLPKGKIKLGESWELTDSLMATLLGLDEIEASAVQSVLTEVTPTAMIFNINGTVGGLVGGASTEIQIKAKYRFLRERKRIDWIGMLIKENRETGHSAGGLDIVAKLDMRISPLKNSEKLQKSALAKFDWDPTDESTRLTINSLDDSWSMEHDRKWFETGHSGKVGILRLIDKGDLIAQCNYSSLPQLDPKKNLSLNDYQAEIKKTLGESFGEFIFADKSTNSHNYRVLHIVADGTVEDLPIRWHYYLISDPNGRQVALNFTVEQELVNKMGEADGPLIDSLEFKPIEKAAEKESASSELK
jgi:hypothetical protein